MFLQRECVRTWNLTSCQPHKVTLGQERKREEEEERECEAGVCCAFMQFEDILISNNKRFKFQCVCVCVCV